MFTNDVGTQTIDDVDYYTFQPNTIVYVQMLRFRFRKTD